MPLRLVTFGSDAEPEPGDRSHCIFWVVTYVCIYIYIYIYINHPLS